MIILTYLSVGYQSYKIVTYNQLFKTTRIKYVNTDLTNQQRDIWTKYGPVASESECILQFKVNHKPTKSSFIFSVIDKTDKTNDGSISGKYRIIGSMFEFNPLVVIAVVVVVVTIREERKGKVIVV